jgi:hypothetical protein
MNKQAGKGSCIRKGANLNAYWNNYPFPERLTVSQWIEKLGEKNVNMDSFKHIPTGTKILEEEFYKNVKYFEELSEKDLEDFRNDIGSMSFSEWQKIKRK